MSRISIVSASAGSGKTFRLASELKDAITRGEARPEAVVATTFTVKAAAELRERVRRRLLRDGEVTAAQRLGAARMGTVNAVCGQLIRDHAFLLGLPPEQRVLDEATGKAVFHRALARVLSQAESAELGELRFRLGDLDWRQAVRKVVEQARLNGVAPGELVGHGARSTASLLALLDAPAADGATLEADLRASVDAFVSGYDAAIDATQKTRKVLQVVDAAARRLARGAPLPWEDWARLSKIQPGVKSAELGAAVRAAAGAHDRHPRLRDELCRLIALVYEIAARALTAYQAVKRDLGAVDFADQESLALALLRREDVRDRLRGEVDLVLVDEFQDTSPVQLAIFLELARVAKRSVWVGDQKQAIYAFRGTDPALMDAAVETILEGAEPDRLTTSYRSRPCWST